MEGEICRRNSLSDDSLRVLARTTLPTPRAVFDVLVFTAGADTTTHVALLLGALKGTDVFVRVHSECLTGDVLGSLRCDCGEQLDASLHTIAAAGNGVLIYLRGHEGRGIGLTEKLRAYALQQELGLDTVDANLALGQPVDRRDYSPAAALLRHLGVHHVLLLTNNNDKTEALINGGVAQVRTVPMRAAVNPHNESYLRAKVERLGHNGVHISTEMPGVA